MMSNASNPQNNIYTNLTTAVTMKGETDTLDSAVYTLSNPEDMDDFVDEVESEIDTDSYSVTSSDEIYEQMLSPLNNISSIAQNIVILVAIAGAVILTLIVILSIRERRYEIGVLMSLGENRVKIIGQFFMELFMVTVVSLIIASFADNFVENALGNQLLSSSTSTEQTTQTQDKMAEVLVKILILLTATIVILVKNLVPLVAAWVIWYQWQPLQLKKSITLISN